MYGPHNRWRSVPQNWGTVSMLQRSARRIAAMQGEEESASVPLEDGNDGTGNAGYSLLSSRLSSPGGRRPYRSCGENSPFSALRESASLPASRQIARYFAYPLNCRLKNAEAVCLATFACLASWLSPMGSRFRQLPSAYL